MLCGGLLAPWLDVTCRRGPGAIGGQRFARAAMCPSSSKNKRLMVVKHASCSQQLTPKRARRLAAVVFRPPTAPTALAPWRLEGAFRGVPMAMAGAASMLDITRERGRALGGRGRAAGPGGGCVWCRTLCRIGLARTPACRKHAWGCRKHAWG